MALLLGYAALGCVAGGLFLIAYTLGRQPPAERPEFGQRGLKRARALDAGGLFPVIEPLIRLVAGWMDGLPIRKVKEKTKEMVGHSGDHNGLSANEVLAMSLLSSVFWCGIAITVVHYMDMKSIFILLGALVGASLPFSTLQSAAKERFKNINRTLPGAIDLAALCMGAGLDFPGALKQIVEKSGTSAADLVEEVGRILQELDLGHTRRKALENFAERCPTEAVRDFVGTVVQAEAKGTPLADVLTIQATMLRMRRSVAAEESAARAGLLMMGPLMMMFCVVILLLMGPFAIRFTETGM